MINYDSERGGVSVVTTKGRTTVSQLLIRRARPPDSGVYTCRPASSKPASVRVHVLQGELAIDPGLWEVSPDFRLQRWHFVD